MRTVRTFIVGIIVTVASASASAQPLPDDFANKLKDTYGGTGSAPERPSHPLSMCEVNAAESCFQKGQEAEQAHLPFDRERCVEEACE